MYIKEVGKFVLICKIIVILFRNHFVGSNLNKIKRSTLFPGVTLHLSGSPGPLRCPQILALLLSLALHLLDISLQQGKCFMNSFSMVILKPAL